MDEYKLVVDFLVQNREKLWDVALKTYGVVDEALKLKLKTEYENYLTNVRLRHSKSKSFFIRDKPVDLYSYYTPSGIALMDDVINSPSFSDVYSSNDKIIIAGSGGSGKTVLMKHLFLDCIKEKLFAPILLELRDYSNKTTLQKLINKTLTDNGFIDSEEFILKSQKEGHFCFFFDGFDEVENKQRKKLIKQIKALSKKYSKCPIIVSSRPDDELHDFEEFSVYKVLPLTIESAKNLIQKLPFDICIKSKFLEDLERELFQKHESFLSNPLLLSIMLLTYSENAEIPTKLSIFYNQAYEALFQRHDAYKGGYTRKRITNLDIQDFGRVFSLFSLLTYEKRIFKMPKTECLRYIELSKDSINHEFISDDYLSDLLGAACLLLEDGLEIAFSHRSFQEYFVALYISNASPEIQKKLINRYKSNIRSDSVMSLLLEIDPELVERELILPSLGELFDYLKVKKTVGITHTSKYFKLEYQKLYIDDMGVSANHRPGKYSSRILHLAIEHCQNFSFGSKEYHEEYKEFMYDKYCLQQNVEQVTYETDNLNIRTEVLKDLVNGKGIFSTNYLQSGFDCYKKIQKKQKSKLQSINELLHL